MHLHGFLFRVLERTHGRRRPGRPRLEGHGRRACPTRRSRCSPWFAPYAGSYVFHCHALEHADKAMMLQMEVVK